MRCQLASIALFLAVGAMGQTPTATLPASPSTVVWGYYSARAKPVLTVHSGDTVRIQTLSTCGPTERLLDQGVAAADIPAYNADIYREVKDKGPGVHILTGPVAIEEAEPGDVLEVDTSGSTSMCRLRATVSPQAADFCPTIIPTAGARSFLSTATI